MQNELDQKPSLYGSEGDIVIENAKSNLLSNQTEVILIVIYLAFLLIVLITLLWL